MWHAAPDRKLPEISRVLEGVPDDLANVIQKLIEKDPAKRYATADEALSDLNIDLKLVKSDDGDGEETADKVEGPDNKRTWIAAGAFGFSLIMSLLLLFWPSGEGSHSGPADSTVGIVRLVDADRRMIEFEDPITGIPDEIQLPERPDITLLNDSQKILIRRIEPGDWIEIDRRGDADGDAVITLNVSRPIVSAGTVTAIDAAGSQVTVSVTEGRVRDEIVMNVRDSSRFTLNGDAAFFRDIHVADRVEADHVLDPSGRGGHWLNALRVQRIAETTGFVEEIDLANRRLTVSFGRGGGADVVYELADDLSVRLMGAPIPLQELAIGDRVRMQVDERVHTIEVTRAQSVVTGLAVAVDDPVGTLVVSTDDGETLTFQLADDFDVTLHRRGIGIRDLRPQIDSLTIRYDVEADGTLLAQTIDAHRSPLNDRWGLVIGTEAYSDRGVSPIRHAIDDAQVMAQVLVERYAVNATRVMEVLDPSLRDVEQQVAAILNNATRQELVIYISGRAYVDGNGDGVLAFSDFRFDDMDSTGMKLPDLVSQLDASSAERVILLLDLSFDGTGPDRNQIVSAEELLASIQDPLSKVTIIGSCSQGERSVVKRDMQRSLFVDRVIAAYGGTADQDRDLRLTPQELIDFLQETLGGVELPRGTTQTPYVRRPSGE